MPPVITKNVCIEILGLCYADLYSSLPLERLSLPLTGHCSNTASLTLMKKVAYGRDGRDDSTPHQWHGLGKLKLALTCGKQSQWSEMTS